MGQYYKVVNVKKKQYITPYIFGDGAKLMEFAMSANGTLTALAVLLADGNGRGGGDLNSDSPIVGSWAGDNIVVAGDYADNGNFLPTDKQELNLYSVASEEGEDISLKVLDALCDDRYFFEEFRRHRVTWINSAEVDDLIQRKLKEKGLTNVKKYQVASAKDPNVKYDVIEDNGKWECNCPSFIYGVNKECKHIRECKN